MTHEEALYRVKGYLTDIIPAEDYSEVEEMAIKALSQEPQCTEQPCLGTLCRYYKEPCRVKNELNVKLNELKPCTDAVSREAIIYYIKGHIHEIITESGTDKNAHTNSILRALINGVETMPSVTQKSGKWIEEVNDFGEITEYHCSKCYEDTGFTTDCKWKFCPNCGAKMESEVAE